MNTLINAFGQIITSIKSYNLNLTGEMKLMFYVILILIFIVSLLILIILEQRTKAKKSESIENPEDNLLLQAINDSELEIDEENEKTRNLKEITDKLQALIDERNIELTNFEKEQEENSIISYQELKEVKQVSQESSQEKEINAKFDESDKFKRSAFISPIFGVQQEQNNLKRETTNEEVNSKLKQDANIELLFTKEEKENVKQATPPTNGECFLKELKQLREDLN